MGVEWYTMPRREVVDLIVLIPNRVTKVSVASEHLHILLILYLKLEQGFPKKEPDY